MSTHFPTVPVDFARLSSHLRGPEGLRPLVLILDDEPLITETLSAILNSSGFAAMTASNAETALEIAHLTPPELLISDVSMPGMNGIELAVEVTRLIPDCEVILFSGHASASDVPRGHGHPDFVFLLKPIHPADLLEHAFRKVKSLTPPVQSPGMSRNPSLYDFLSSAGLRSEIYQSSWTMSTRSRSRTLRPTA